MEHEQSRNNQERSQDNTHLSYLTFGFWAQVATTTSTGD
jgi:hypothetical protein